MRGWVSIFLPDQLLLSDRRRFHRCIDGEPIHIRGERIEAPFRGMVKSIRGSGSVGVEAGGKEGGTGLG